MRKGLAVLARFLDAAEPDARLPVVLCLPIKLEESGHARMVDFPHQCAVLYDLLDGWCAHKKKRPAGPLPSRCDLRNRSWACSELRQGRRS